MYKMTLLKSILFAPVKEWVQATMSLLKSVIYKSNYIDTYPNVIFPKAWHSLSAIIYQIFNVDTFKASSLMFISLTLYKVSLLIDIYWHFEKRHYWSTYVNTYTSAKECLKYHLSILILKKVSSYVDNNIENPLIEIIYFVCPVMYNFGYMIFYKVQNNNFNINNYIFQKKLNKFGNNIMIKN